MFAVDDLGSLSANNVQDCSTMPPDPFQVVSLQVIV